MADMKLILAIFTSLIVAVSSRATCEGDLCPPGTTCGYRQVWCVRSPCEPVRECLSAKDYTRCPKTCGRNGCVLPIGPIGLGWCYDCTQRKCPARDCPNGILKDSKGCNTCSCRPPRCHLLKCMTPICPYGILKDSRGCDTCSCKPTRCPLLKCMTPKCQFGILKDGKGCNTCSCKPTQCLARPCAPPIVPCLLGMKLDSNGCPTCDCKDSECPLIKCALYCLDGYLKDKNGCNTCTCKPNLLK